MILPQITFEDTRPVLRAVEETMQFAVQNGVRSRNGILPLDQATAASDKILSGSARFRMVLTTDR
jgi:alcohol dehydrogenase